MNPTTMGLAVFLGMAVLAFLAVAGMINAAAARKGAPRGTVETNPRLDPVVGTVEGEDPLAARQLDLAERHAAELQRIAESEARERLEAEAVARAEKAQRVKAAAKRRRVKARREARAAMIRRISAGIARVRRVRFRWADLKIGRANRKARGFARLSVVDADRPRIFRGDVLRVATVYRLRTVDGEELATFVSEPASQRSYWLAGSTEDPSIEGFLEDRRALPVSTAVH